MAVDVRTPVFEGPLDLLLHLILKEEVDLYEVSLLDIVDAYLTELARMAEADPLDGEGRPRLDLEIATEFLLIAATLVELKARRLLPDPEGDELDEDLWLWEERDLLLARLVQCRTFKNVAERLDDRLERARRSVARTAGLDERFLDLAPDLLEGVAPADLARAFARATRPRPEPTVSLAHITPITASVTEALAELARDLPRRRRTTFRQLTGHLTDRIEIVVRFLAVLELYKEGLVDLDQPTSFGELDIRWLGADVADVDLVLAGADAYDG